MKACKEARISLRPSETDTPSYVIILGADSNTKSRIYKGTDSTAVSQSDTPDVISCTESRTFWISWAAGTIQIAIKSDRGRRVIAWTDSSPATVHVIGMATGPGAEGEWRFSRSTGKQIKNQTF